MLEENTRKVFPVDALTELKVVGKLLTQAEGAGVGIEDKEVGVELREGDKLLVIVVEVVGGAVGSFTPRVLPVPGKESVLEASVT